MTNFVKTRTFYKKLPLFIKNSILHIYKKLKPLIWAFIKNSIFGNNRDPCPLLVYNLSGLRPLGKHYQYYSGTVWCAVQRTPSSLLLLDTHPVGYPSFFTSVFSSVFWGGHFGYTTPLQCAHRLQSDMLHQLCHYNLPASHACVATQPTHQGSLLIPKMEFFIKADIWGWSFL